MQVLNMVGLAGQKFKGVDGFSMKTSLEQMGLIWVKQGDYFHFTYETDEEKRIYSMGVIPVDATRESEYNWVTQGQWNKIAEVRGRSVEEIMGGGIVALTWYVYDYFGAEAIFSKPQSMFKLEVSG